jgi:hypothetical protein
MPNNNQDTPLDKWELALEVELKILQQCQDDKNISSCTICSEFLQCNIRKKYISAVYESMNKGSGGGFEF